MLSKKMEKALNKQVNAEFYAAYLYLAISADFSRKSLNGMADWYHKQAQEEVEHAMKFYNHIQERQGVVILEPIAAVPSEWATPMSAFKAALVHEQKVTGMINALMDIAVGEKDYASQSFLKWFIDEQVEEESEATANIDRLTMLGGKDGKSISGGSLYQLDKLMGKRSGE
ncbi:MAG: ferritin [Prevotellaceae bacterium]|jgi:ferritin|nr:ferritin [Prevotellaceae bacterium]